ncbi:MAG: hypothetical protein IJI05_05545 [Erysipelotrichaceae bacterium]|nr:hypothetical protein [Erysipelotrichaceae bacterium]
MKMTYGKVRITPFLPVQMSGFSAFQVAREVHDDLFARLFLFEQDGEELLWVQNDLACFDGYLYDLIARKSHVGTGQLLTSSTHTHSGPGGIIDTYSGVNAGLDENLGGPLNAEYCHRVAELIGEETQRMRGRLKPFIMTIRLGEVHGLGTDRHDPTLPADETALAIEFDTDGHKVLLTRMSCHATVMNGENQQITADFPGAIERYLPEYEMTAFVNGSAGDMSTRFTRRENTFAEVERYGQLVSEQLREIMKQPAESYDGFDLHLLHRTFTVPVRDVGTVEEAMQRRQQAYEKLQQAQQQGLTDIELRLISSLYEGACNALLSTRAFAKLDHIDIPVSILRLPGLLLMFTPVEMFSKLSDPLKKDGILHIGYSNGYLQYMPDRNAYEKNYYEVQSTPYEKGAGEQLMVGVREWLKQEGLLPQD